MPLTPYGIGTPAPSADPPTGDAGVRYIDPASHDYAFDSATGQLAQMPTVRQRVLLAVTQLRGSSTALPNDGINLPRKMGDTFVAEMQQSVRAALRQLTDVEKLVRIDGIDVIKGQGGRSQTTITYTDLSSGQPDSVTT
jgi:hypothetical protein